MKVSSSVVVDTTPVSAGASRCMKGSPQGQRQELHWHASIFQGMLCFRARQSPTLEDDGTLAPIQSQGARKESLHIMIE